MAASKVVSSFTERIKDVDPDLRQMALFDLQQALSEPSVALNDQEQDTVGKALLTCFTVREVNSEVHSKAVHILSVLVPKAPRQRTPIAAELVKLMWDTVPDTKSAEVIRILRDNAAMGLKSIVEGLTLDHKDTIIAITPQLLNGLSMSKDSKIRMDLYDALAEIVKKFGRQIGDKHAEIQAHALKDFDGDLSLRKRAVNCVAVLSQVSADALFEQVLNLTLKGLETDKGEKLRRHIQLCNTVSRVAGSRFGSAVGKVLPLFFKELERLQNAPQEESESVAADEVREHILQAIECFVSRCPDFASSLLPQIVNLCATLLAWDPNYCEMPEGEDDEDDDEALDDGDDISWRVRKAAARVLLAAVKALPQQLHLFYAALASKQRQVLHGRFRERVENVRLEVFEVTRAIFDASKLQVGGGADAAGHGSGSFQMSQELLGGSFRVVFEASPEVASLVPIKTELVNALLASLRHRSPKVKLSCFLLLRDVFALLGAELASAVPSCVAAVTDALANPALALPHLRPDVLNFARIIVSVGVRLQSVNPEHEKVVGPALESLLAPIFLCVEDRYFKTVCGALRVCAELVAAVRASPNQLTLAPQLFNCVQGKLMTADTDQEVKRAAIEAMSHILRFLEGPITKVKPADVEKSYGQLLVLIKNEATRLTVSKAVLQLYRCRLSKDVVKGFASELTALLRKNDRQLREAALRALIVFVPAHAATIDEPTLQSIIVEMCNDSTASLLSDKELFLTSLGLQLLHKACQAQSQGKNALTIVVPRVLSLMSTPLMGHTVKDAATVLDVIARRPDVAYADMLAKTIEAVGKADAGNIGNLAALAGVVVGADTDVARRTRTTASFAAMTKTAGKETIGLACLGEVGRLSQLTPEVVAAVRAAVSSPKDEIKTAAAIALGKSAASPAGSGTLQSILSDIQSRPTDRYFLLRALREAIHTASGLPQSPLATKDVRTATFGVLFAFSASTDEGVADIVAECLGKYAALDARATLSSMAEALGPAKPESQATLILAARIATTTLPQTGGAPEALAEFLPAFLAAVAQRSSVVVRRAALQLLTAVAATSPALLLTEAAKTVYLPSLFKELDVDKSLVTEVDLGPFKHIVDKGLEVRKAAFEAAATLIEGATRARSVLEFAHGFDALADRLAGALWLPEFDMEINAAARKMLARLSKTPSGAAAVAAHGEKIAAALIATIVAAVKDGQDRAQVVEGQRQAVVCVLKLEAVPGLLAQPKFAEAIERARKSALFEQARASLGAD